MERKEKRNTRERVRAYIVENDAAYMDPYLIQDLTRFPLETIKEVRREIILDNAKKRAEMRLAMDREQILKECKYGPVPEDKTLKEYMKDQDLDNFSTKDMSLAAHVPISRINELLKEIRSEYSSIYVPVPEWVRNYHEDGPFFGSFGYKMRQDSEAWNYLKYNLTSVRPRLKPKEEAEKSSLLKLDISGVISEKEVRYRITKETGSPTAAKYYLKSGEMYTVSKFLEESAVMEIRLLASDARYKGIKRIHFLNILMKRREMQPTDENRAALERIWTSVRNKQRNSNEI